MLCPPFGIALLVATSGEAEVPLGIAWLGTGEARLGGAAETLGEADAFKSVFASSSSLKDNSIRSCDTTRPRAAVAFTIGTGLLLLASDIALPADASLLFVKAVMFVAITPRNEPRDVLQLVLVR